MADDLDADWKQDHTAIMPALTKYWKHGGMYFENHVAAGARCSGSQFLNALLVSVVSGIYNIEGGLIVIMLCGLQCQCAVRRGRRY